MSGLPSLIDTWERGIAQAERRLERETDPAERALIEEGLRLLREHRDEMRAQSRADEGGENTMTMIRSTAEGITITRAALKALLAFTVAEDPSERFDVVALQVSGDEVVARASDGLGALTFRGPAVDASEEARRWDIGVAFLKACAKSLSGSDELRIEPHGATVQNATVFRQAADGEDHEEAESITYHYDAARLQQQFPWEESAALGRLRRGREPCGQVMLDADLLARLALVKRAAGCDVLMRLGEDPEQPVRCDFGDDATVVLMPCRASSKAKGKRGKAGSEEAGAGVEQAALKFRDAMQKIADKDDATISFQAPGGPKVVIAAPKRGRKAKA